MFHFKYKDFKKCLPLVWMSDGRAAVLCLLCSLSLFILFWFSMCFRYFVYISPSLFLSCSFASFCSPSKSHKVSLFLFFLLLILRAESSEHRSGQNIWNSLWPELPAPSPSPAMCFYTCVCPTVSVPVLWLHSPTDTQNLHTALKCPWGIPRAPLEQSRNPFQHWEYPEAALCTSPVAEEQPVHRLGSFCLNLI